MADLSMDDLATKQDLQNLKKDLKQELAQFITKEEFRQELAKVATKEELSNLREELLDKLSSKESVEVVAGQVLKNTNDIVEIKAKLNEIDWKIEDIREDIKGKFDTILISLDKLSGEISNNRAEKAAIDHALMRHDERFEKHEKRITQLERKCA